MPRMAESGKTSCFPCDHRSDEPAFSQVQPLVAELKCVLVHYQGFLATKILSCCADGASWLSIMAGGLKLRYAKKNLFSTTARMTNYTILVSRLALATDPFLRLRRFCCTLQLRYNIRQAVAAKQGIIHWLAINIPMSTSS